jgi:hypothetical protein
VANSAAETQRLLATYRKHPRPSYYSAISGASAQISYEYETKLILMENMSKQAIIERLRKSIDKATQSADRDALAKMAAQFESAAASAAGSDFSLAVGDYTSFADKELKGDSSAETSQLVSDIGAALGPTLFQRDQADYDLIAAGLETDELKMKKSAADRKKQLSSWIEIFVSYMTK